MTAIPIAVAPKKERRPALQWRLSTRLAWFSAICGGLTLLPIAAIVMRAAQGEAGDSLWPHLIANVLPQSLWTTAVLLSGIAAVSGTLGVLSAWAVTQYEFVGRRHIDWLLILPLALPTYITAYCYVEIAGFQGPLQTLFRGVTGYRTLRDYWFPDIRSWGGAVLIFSFVLYPYVYLTTRALFAVQAASIVESPRTLGARPGRLFWQVGLPMARPALAAGLTLVLLETLNDVGATQYLGVPTLTLSVYSTWLNRGSLAGAAQIACILLVVILGTIVLEAKLRAQRRFAIPTRQSRMVGRKQLTSRQGSLVALACLMPVAFGFGVPALFLLHEIFREGIAAQANGGLIRALATTLAYAGVATAVTMAMACGVVAATRFGREGWIAGATRIAGLGYALPGTVLALGLLVPIGFLDNVFATSLRSWTGLNPGLVLFGSGGALVLAYVVRFLTVGISGLQSGMARISPHVDDAARSLGASSLEVMQVLHWPMVRPALSSAALLVFVDCIKELPATLLLRPLNVETLATVVYGHASRGSFEDGALAALLIVLAGIYPVVRLMRAGEPAIRG